MEIKVVSGWFDAELHNVKQGFNLSLFKALNLLPKTLGALGLHKDGSAQSSTLSPRGRGSHTPMRPAATLWEMCLRRDGADEQVPLADRPPQRGEGAAPTA